MYFKNKYWKITADGIEEKPLVSIENHLWSEQVINFDATLLKESLVDVTRIEEEHFQKDKTLPVALREFIGSYSVDLSKQSEQCHFLNFIWNTGEFFWRKKFNADTREPITDSRDLSERLETQLHFVSKMTAIGYLLHSTRDKSCEKAVIAMDGKISEVGDSNGRSGKSLVGFAISKLIPQVYISGKAKDLTDDTFLFEEVNDKTQNIFLDDVRANIDFEFFFPLITGRLTVNAKGIGKNTLPEKNTPKLYLTTNHAINGSTSSYRDRQALIAFSDFYNNYWNPVMTFGLTLID